MTTARYDHHRLRAVCKEGEYDDEYIDNNDYPSSPEKQHNNKKNHHPSTMVTFLKFCAAFFSMFGLYQSFTLGLYALMTSQRERIRHQEQEQHQQQQDSLLPWVNDQSVLPRDEEIDTEIDELDYAQLQCYNESFGYFTDILNETWIRMKRRAQQAIMSMHQYKFPDHPERAHGVPTRWYARNLLPVFSCPHVIRVGGHGEGPK
jgi:Methyltransferase domain